MIYATFGDRWARALRVGKVERQTSGGNWKDVTRDVLRREGGALVFVDLPTSVITAGARWRVDGVEYENGAISTKPPMRVQLRRA